MCKELASYSEGGRGDAPRMSSNPGKIGKVYFTISKSVQLYTLLTNDLSPPVYSCLDIMYADDVTQIITSPSKSKLMIKAKVEQEIERISKFERTWKWKPVKKNSKLYPSHNLKLKTLK